MSIVDLMNSDQPFYFAMVGTIISHNHLIRGGWKLAKVCYKNFNKQTYVMRKIYFNEQGIITRIKGIEPDARLGIPIIAFGRPKLSRHRETDYPRIQQNKCRERRYYANILQTNGKQTQIPTTAF